MGQFFSLCYMSLFMRGKYGGIYAVAVSEYECRALLWDPFVGLCCGAVC